MELLTDRIPHRLRDLLVQEHSKFLQEHIILQSPSVRRASEIRCEVHTLAFLSPSCLSLGSVASGCWALGEPSLEIRTYEYVYTTGAPMMVI